MYKVHTGFSILVPQEKVNATVSFLKDKLRYTDETVRISEPIPSFRESIVGASTEGIVRVDINYTCYIYEFTLDRDFVKRGPVLEAYKEAQMVLGFEGRTTIYWGENKIDTMWLVQTYPVL